MSSGKRKVTLTFDNGREPGVTPGLLDCLARHAIKTTFFVMGRKVITPEGSALVRRAKAEGHWIVITRSRPPRHSAGWIGTLADCQSRDWTLLVLHDLPNGAMAHLEEFITILQRERSEFKQEFPPDCLPIVDGKVVLPLHNYISG